MTTFATNTLYLAVGARYRVTGLADPATGLTDTHWRFAGVDGPYARFSPTRAGSDQFVPVDRLDRVGHAHLEVLTHPRPTRVKVTRR